MNRNVVLLPDESVKELAITLSQQIAKRYKTTFVLDGNMYHPHITLYQAAYPEKSLSNVEKQLSIIARASKPFVVRVEGVSALWGYIFLDIVPGGFLKSLHEAVVSSLNDLRNGMLMDSVESMLSSDDISQKVKDSIRMYGSPFAMGAFLPHITLCGLQNSRDSEEVLALLGKLSASFDVDALHLANIGANGTVNEVFGSYPFVS